MLMVTTTVRMVNGIHSNTTSARPARKAIRLYHTNIGHRHALITLGFEFVVSTTGLEQRLVDTTTASNNTDRGAGSTRYGLLGTARQSDSRLSIVWRVANYSCVVTGCASKCTTIANLLFNIADNGTFGALADGENISNIQSSFLSAVDKGPSVKTFSSNKSLFLELVTVGITEDNTGKGCTARVGKSQGRIMLGNATNRPASWIISFTTPRM